MKKSLLSVLLFASASAAAPLNIQLNFGSGFTPAQQSIFTLAANTWMSLLVGYAPGINISALQINASAPFIDGAGGTLGQAGPTFVTNQGGFTLATQGIMQFDSADVAQLELDGLLQDVILHEMGHVLGLGTLWTSNNVYVNGTGQYTGAFGLAAYRAEFNQPLAAFVPVELGGGTGTANGHWNEVDGGAGLTGITDAQGRDMRDELMTGWLNGNSFISNLTVQSFRDIGYAPTAIPEPSTIILVSGAFGLLLFRHRRR